ncbi:MAG TPA: helix-turn-helix domain-containing protein [Terriglobia bacterium]
MKDLMERLISEMVSAGVFFQDAVAEFEKRYIRKLLEASKGNQSQAAKALGIHRNTLGRKMEEYHLASRNGAARSRRAVRRRK